MRQVIHRTKEASQLLLVFWNEPVWDRIHFLWIRLNTIFCQHIAKEMDLWSFKLYFPRVQVHINFYISVKKFDNFKVLLLLICSKASAMLVIWPCSIRSEKSSLTHALNKSPLQLQPICTCTNIHMCEYLPGVDECCVEWQYQA